MNKRIKKKRELETKVEAFGQYMQVVHHTIERFGDCLERIVQTTSLQEEVIEDYGRQLGEVKRELADLRAIVERNAQAANARFDYLEKKVADKVSKKSWFGRK